MKTVTAEEAVEDFARVLADVEHGEEVVISRHGSAVARVLPSAGRPSVRPKVGSMLDAPMEVPVEALRPLSPDELRQWGL